MKDFIPHNEALALKELGFDEEKLMMYSPKGVLWEYSSDGVIAPLYSQAFRWFREKHKLDSSYGTTSDYDEKIHGYVICNFIDGTRNHLIKNWEVGTYEEAELECLRKLIEIVKTK